jgi:membrane protease YdiL (CAAX protease family)
MDPSLPATLLRAQPETPRPPESPTKLLLLAVAWFIAGVASAVMAVSVLALVAVIHNAARSAAQPSWQIGNVAYGLLALLAMDITLLFAAWRRGRIVGQGNAIAGLGAGPIRRPRLLAALAAAYFVTSIGWTLLLGQWVDLEHAPAVVDLLQQAADIGPAMQVAIVLCIVGFAPLWEELFFRGWLWTGLRHRWGMLPVMLATALPWLLAHLSDGLARPLFLIPGAIFLSLAREYCGGVRASLVLHLLNNLVVMLFIGLAMQSRLR